MSDIQDQIEHRSTSALKAGIAAMCVSLILIMIKGLAWLMSGSTAVLASMADSVSDAFVSVINFMAIKQSIKPADKDHRYGHGKVEGLAALFQSAFIAAAGFFVLMEATDRLIDPVPVTHHFLALGVMLTSVVLTLVLVRIQTRSMKSSGSLAVEADRAHYMSDSLVHVIVIGTIIADLMGAPFWIDPLGGIAVTVYLGHTSVHVGKKGLDMLLDRELDGHVREQILTTVLRHKDVHGAHDLRTRRTGMIVHISFDMELDPNLSLRTAHEICKQVEAELLKDFPNAEIMIHKDPVGDTDDSRHQVKGLHHA